MQSFLIPAADPNATPSTIAARRKLAEAMLAASTDAQPVQSWSQGAAKIAQAMMGGLAMRRAGQEEAAGRKSAGEALAAALNGNPSQQDYGPALSNPWIDPSVVTGIMNHRDQVAYQQQQMGLQQQQFQLAQDQAKQSQAWHDQQMQLEQDKFRWEQGGPQRNIDMFNGVVGGGVPPGQPQAAGPQQAASSIPAPMPPGPGAAQDGMPPVTYRAPGVPGGQGVTAMPGRGIDVAAQQAAAAGGATPEQATLAPVAAMAQASQNGPRVDQGSIPIPPEVMRAARMAAISNPAAGAQMIQEYRQHQADQMRQDYYQSPEFAAQKDLATGKAKLALSEPDVTVAAQNKLMALDQLSREAGEIAGDQSLYKISGAEGMFPDFPGGSAAAVRARLESLKTKIAFNALQALREGSPTGGALGAVSNQEQEMLMNSIASLDTKQGVDELKKRLGEISNFANTHRSAVMQEYKAKFGKDVPSIAQQQDADSAAMPASQEEWAKLPPGTQYIAPDGSTRVKR